MPEDGLVLRSAGAGWRRDVPAGGRAARHLLPSAEVRHRPCARLGCPRRLQRLHGAQRENQLIYTSRGSILSGIQNKIVRNIRVSREETYKVHKVNIKITELLFPIISSLYIAFRYQKF